MNPTRTTLRVETLECRLVPAPVVPTYTRPTVVVVQNTGSNGLHGWPGATLMDVRVEGSTLFITGTDMHDRVQIWERTNQGGRSLDIWCGVTEGRRRIKTEDFKVYMGATWTVQTIVFRGRGGDDVFAYDDEALRLFGVLSANILADGGRDNDNIQTGNGNDLLVGGPGIDTLDGRGGDDILLGGGGNDSLSGGGGSNILLGGAGQDKLFGGPLGDILDGGVADRKQDQLSDRSSVNLFVVAPDTTEGLVQFPFWDTINGVVPNYSGYALKNQVTQVSAESVVVRALSGETTVAGTAEFVDREFRNGVRAGRMVLDARIEFPAADVTAAMRSARE